jgi:hypothetical protein
LPKTSFLALVNLLALTDKPKNEAPAWDGFRQTNDQVWFRSLDRMLLHDGVAIPRTLSLVEDDDVLGRSCWSLPDDVLLQVTLDSIDEDLLLSGPSAKRMLKHLD